MYVNCRWRTAFCTLGIPLSNFGPETGQNDCFRCPVWYLFQAHLWTTVSGAIVGLLFIPEDIASTFVRNFSETLLASSSPPRGRIQHVSQLLLRQTQIRHTLTDSARFRVGLSEDYDVSSVSSDGLCSESAADIPVPKYEPTTLLYFHCLCF